MYQNKQYKYSFSIHFKHVYNFKIKFDIEYFLIEIYSMYV